MVKKEAYVFLNKEEHLMLIVIDQRLQNRLQNEHFLISLSALVLTVLTALTCSVNSFDLNNHS